MNTSHFPYAIQIVLFGPHKNYLKTIWRGMANSMSGPKDTRVADNRRRDGMQSALVPFVLLTGLFQENMMSQPTRSRMTGELAVFRCQGNESTEQN